MHEIAPEKIDLGQRLAQARDLAGLTQPTVAVLLTNAGIQSTKQAVSAWEKGRNVPDALVLKQLARLYDTSADALLGLATASVEAVRLALVFDALPHDARAGLLEVLGPFLDKHVTLNFDDLVERGLKDVHLKDLSPSTASKMRAFRNQMMHSTSQTEEPTQLGGALRRYLSTSQLEDESIYRALMYSAALPDEKPPKPPTPQKQPSKKSSRTG